MVILATFIGACLGFVACGMCSTGKSADCSFCSGELSDASEAIQRAFAERIRGATWIDLPPSSEPIPAELLSSSKGAHGARPRAPFSHLRPRL
jgi:hypothetical protein